MSTDIKQVVKEKYGEAARKVIAIEPGSSCCAAQSSSDCISSNLYDATQTKDLPEAAVLASLGCGNPTALAARGRAREENGTPGCKAREYFIGCGGKAEAHGFRSRRGNGHDGRDEDGRDGHVCLCGAGVLASPAKRDAEGRCVWVGDVRGVRHSWEGIAARCGEGCGGVY